MQVNLVRVNLEKEAGWYFAVSQDLTGLMVTVSTVEELANAIPQAIADLYTASEIAVHVRRVEGKELCWVVIPYGAA